MHLQTIREWQGQAKSVVLGKLIGCWIHSGAHVCHRSCFHFFSFFKVVLFPAHVTGSHSRDNHQTDPYLAKKSSSDTKLLFRLTKQSGDFQCTDSVHRSSVAPFDYIVRSIRIGYSSKDLKNTVIPHFAQSLNSWHLTLYPSTLNTRI